MRESSSCDVARSAPAATGGPCRRRDRDHLFSVARDTMRLARTGCAADEAHPGGQYPMRRGNAASAPAQDERIPTISSRLDDIPWPAIPSSPVLLVPVGSTEQHGPHLPLDVDTLIATAVCRGAAERLGRGVLVAPPVAYGASGEHEGFPGTLSIGTEALTVVLVELARSARRWAGRIVFVKRPRGQPRRDRGRARDARARERPGRLARLPARGRPRRPRRDEPRPPPRPRARRPRPGRARPALPPSASSCRACARTA